MPAELPPNMPLDRVDRFVCSENFQLAWADVAAKRGCAGVDGVTIAQIAVNPERYLGKLRRSLQDRTYRPLPLRQIVIPKTRVEGRPRTASDVRKLAVPAVRDRIVQHALLNVLHPLLEPQFESCSFAYRPGRSHQLAVQQVETWRDRSYGWVLDADIVSYFDQIQHQRLIAEVQEKLNQEAERLRGDRANPYRAQSDRAAPQILDFRPGSLTALLAVALPLLRGWIAAPILTPAGLVFPTKGIPQGAVISPILANVYLNVYLDDLDEALLMQNLKLVRYADDFVVLARSREDIVQARAEVERLLREMHLELHPDKTRVTNFRQGFRFLGHQFAGNLALPIKSTQAERRETARQSAVLRQAARASTPYVVHADPPVQPTAMQQELMALVAQLKAEQRPIPPPLFVVLGYQVRPHTPVVIQSAEPTWRTSMPTLYLTQQGATLSKTEGCFVVTVAKEPRTEVLIKDVQRILVFGSVQVTTAVISTCLQLQIPVVFLSQLGEYKGHLWSAEAADLIVETAQFQRRQDGAFQRRMAQAIVQGKLWNSKQLLLRLNRKRQLPTVSAAIAKLDELYGALDSANTAQTLDHIRGYEGAGAAQYFAALGQLIVHPDLSFGQRVFHPPTDPVNSLLSFGYTLLLNNVLSLLLAEGLNPYLGNLHGAERPKAYLAFDLMEEFRSPIVDTLVLKLVNQRVISPTDFTFPNAAGGVYLNDPARRVFLKRFEDRMSETITHPDVKESVSHRRVIQLQVQRYAGAVLGNAPYESFRRMT